ncbi:M48 family metallopeptidase [candidate division KSB1 bacterium]|nr:M48 family metallopeptidase [candidate division KSB1 bacterium]
MKIKKYRSTIWDYREELDGLGWVTFKANTRIHNLRLRLCTDGELIIEYPSRVGYKHARMFVLENKDWFIKRNRALRKRFDSEIHIQRFKMSPKSDQAKKIIMERVAQLACSNGFFIKRVSVRNQKSRWGSCSSKNNINLNINLIQLPDHLMDYVIFHELVHTHVRNHGPNFWKELNKYVNEGKKIDTELRRYRLVD